jgi:hypothetical protein
MQKRERMLALATGVLLGGWLLDGMVAQPALAWLAGVRKQTAELAREAGEARVLIDRQARILADWRARHAAGLLDDVDGARFRIQQALAGGARSSGFAIDNVGGGQLVPAAHDQVYDTLRITVAGQGTLAQVQAFLAGIEGAALPLRIERCELAGGDGRKDQIDVALTLSTRLAGAAARAGRALPEGTAAWKPEARDGRLDGEVLAGKPFLNERKAARREHVASASEAKPAPPAGWALVGIVVKSDAATAFLRSLGDGGERQLQAGDEIDGSRVEAIDSVGLHLGANGEQRLVTVGSDLSGRPAGASGRRGATTASLPATGAPAAAGATPAAPAAAPFAVPAVTPDADRDAILQRLRQQRNRSP